MQKKKKWLLILLVCVLVAGLCLAAGALGMRYLNRQLHPGLQYLGSGVNNISPPYLNNQQGDIAQRLWAQKHPYIGRVPSDLLQLLTKPKELYYFATQQHTKEEPYGLQLWYGTDKAGYQALLTDPDRQKLLQKNALIIMALIDNCDFVQYSIKWDDVKIHYSNYDHSDFERMGRDGFTLTYDKAWADAAIDGNIKAVAGTEEDFRAFLSTLDQLELSPVEPEVMG